MLRVTATAAFLLLVSLTPLRAQELPRSQPEEVELSAEARGAQARDTRDHDDEPDRQADGLRGNQIRPRFRPRDEPGIRWPQAGIEPRFLGRRVLDEFLG